VLCPNHPTHGSGCNPAAVHAAAMLLVLLVLLVLQAGRRAGAAAVGASAPRLAWNYTLPAPPTGGVMLSPAEDVVYALTTDGVNSYNDGRVVHHNASLTAVSTSDGRVRWQVELPCPNRFKCASFFGPLAEQSAVYAVGTAGVFKLSADTGEVLWLFAFPAADDDAAASGELLLVQNGTSNTVLVCPLGNLGVVALDTTTGKQVWSYEPALEECMTGTLSALTSEVMFPCNGQTGSLVAIGIATGAVRTVWQATASHPAGLNGQGITLGGGGSAYYFAWTWGGIGHLLATNNFGTPRWSLQTGATVEARPVLVPSPQPPLPQDPLALLLTADFKGVLRALDPLSGNVSWSVTPGDLSTCERGFYQCLSIQAAPSFIHGGRTALVSVMDGPNHGQLHVSQPPRSRPAAAGTPIAASVAMTRATEGKKDTDQATRRVHDGWWWVVGGGWCTGSGHPQQGSNPVDAGRAGLSGRCDCHMEYDYVLLLCVRCAEAAALTSLSLSRSLSRLLSLSVGETH
jgi:hypothetical protein